MPTLCAGECQVGTPIQLRAVLAGQKYRDIFLKINKGDSTVMVIQQEYVYIQASLRKMLPNTRVTWLIDQDNDIVITL